jgi:energy-coupling factor transport system permease protein
MLSIGSFHIYSGAVSQTLYIVVRLALMVIITTILTATTKPLDLTLGIEDLLKPFRRIGVPAHEIAMMISIALRFIPTLIEETQRIMKAQASRGVDMSSGSLKEKIGAVLSLIVPLFVSAFDRAEQLANAMEARGYVPGRNRTRYKSLKLHGIDIALLAGSFLLLGVLIAMGALGCA